MLSSLTHNYSEMYKLDILVQLVIIAESGVWGFPTFPKSGPRAC